MARRGNRRHIPPEQKQLITTMANHLKPKAIAQITHMHQRTVYRTIETWRKTCNISL
ncbi:hypothetical protein C8J57DRAFT_1304899, partial [Mycena rebaudengoi]